MMELIPKEQRQLDWPKLCLESWLETFRRWEEGGQGKILSDITIHALTHALQCNLLYIEELEAELQDRKLTGEASAR